MTWDLINPLNSTIFHFNIGVESFCYHFINKRVFLFCKKFYFLFGFFNKFIYFLGFFIKIRNNLLLFF